LKFKTRIRKSCRWWILSTQ